MSTSRPKTRAQAKAGQARRAKAAKPEGGAGKRWAKRLGITALAGFLLVVVAFFVAYATIDTPKPNDLAIAQASIIYYADGKTEIDRISEVNRESVLLKQVPKPVQEAHLAAEDRNFYENSGISPTGIAPRCLGDPARRRHPGRVDDHPAVRQELLPDPGPDAVAQGQGDHHLHQDRQAAVQGPDPRELPQHDLLRPRRVRHPDGLEGVLQQGRLQADPLRGCVARLGHPGAVLLRPGLGASQKANAEARWKYVMDGMVTEGWLTSGGACRGKVPEQVAGEVPAQPQRLRTHRLHHRRGQA